MNERITSKNSKRDTLRQRKGRARPSAAKSRRESAPQDEHLRFERLISDLSARFVNISPDQVDREIERALERVLEFFQVDRCGLLSISPDRKRVYVTHAAYAEDIERVSGDIDLAALFPWSYEKLVIQGQPVCLEKTEELPVMVVVLRICLYELEAMSGNGLTHRGYCSFSQRFHSPIFFSVLAGLPMTSSFGPNS